MSNPVKLKAQVLSVKSFGPDTYSVKFKPEVSPPRFKAGQFLHLTIDEYDPAGGFWPESRVFSIASAPGMSELEIVYSVKGRYTRRMADHLSSGREVWLKLPYGNFIIDSSIAPRQDVFRQAKIPKKIVQISPSGHGDFCLVLLPHKRMFHAVTLTFEQENVSMVRKPVDHRRRHLVVRENTSPLRKLKIRGENEAPLFIRISDDAEQQLRALPVDRHIPPLVDDQEVCSQHARKQFVEHSLLEGFRKPHDQFCRGEELRAHRSVAGFDAECRGQMRRASPHRSVHDKIRFPGDKLYACQFMLAQCGRQGDARKIESVECLVDGECRFPQKARPASLLPARHFAAQDLQEEVLHGSSAFFLAELDRRLAERHFLQKLRDFVPQERTLCPGPSFQSTSRSTTGSGTKKLRRV